MKLMTKTVSMDSTSAKGLRLDADFCCVSWMYYGLGYTSKHTHKQWKARHNLYEMRLWMLMGEWGEGEILQTMNFPSAKAYGT